MQDILKIFDNCISDLENEIQSISDGEFDNNLEDVLSYAIKEEYMNTVGSHCDFPSPPILPIITEDNNETIDTSPNTNTVNDIPERRSGRSHRKRNLDIIESEFTDPQDTDRTDTSTPQQKATTEATTPARRSARMRSDTAK
mmetsp:Transcript_10899/g.16608  ORF Transcript_10899/g.16608 Transcript_10899/m.16608 type:complete len:142 (+) Transcript_10899:50-475(+)